MKTRTTRNLWVLVVTVEVELENMCRHFRNTVSLSLQKLHAEVAIHSFQIRKLRHNVVMCLDQVYTADKWQGKNVQVCLTPRPGHSLPHNAE